MTAQSDETAEGGCLCGKIRYSFSGAPLITAICHCRHCQKQGGSAFSVVCAVPDAAYVQTGQTRIFNDTGESGKILARHFCPDCGSPIVSIAEAMPGLTIIKAGTLDEPSQFLPALEAYCDSAVTWMPAFPATQRFAGSNVGDAA